MEWMASRRREAKKTHTEYSKYSVLRHVFDGVCSLDPSNYLGYPRGLARWRLAWKVRRTRYSVRSMDTEVRILCFFSLSPCRFVSCNTR